MLLLEKSESGDLYFIINQGILSLVIDGKQYSWWQSAFICSYLGPGDSLCHIGVMPGFIQSQGSYVTVIGVVTVKLM